MTGLIGMAGGIGGFCLTAGLGAIKQSTGDYQLGLWLFASLGVLAWFGLHGVKLRWRTTWGSAAVTAARRINLCQAPGYTARRRSGRLRQRRGNHRLLALVRKGGVATLLGV